MNAHAKYRIEPAEQVRARRVREQAILQYMLFQQVATEPPIVNKDELEASIQDYVVSLLSTFAEVKRVLKCAGSFWLNIGDAYRDKNLCGVPWRVAIALQD